MVRAYTRLQEGYHTNGIRRRAHHHLSASQWALQNSHQQEARGKVLVLLKDETINALNSRTAKQWISQTSAGSAFTSRSRNIGSQIYRF